MNAASHRGGHAMRSAIPLLCLLLSLPAQAAGDPKLGKPLHDKQCVACHVKLLGGDGSAMYTRKPRR
jgi:mono/diheme cytochrome c family protein